MQLFTRAGIEQAPNGKTEKGAPVYRYERACFRCGGAGGSDKWAHTGWTCYDCNGKGKAATLGVEKLYTAEKLTKLVEAQAKRDAAKKAARDEAAVVEAERAARERHDVLTHYDLLLKRIRAAVPVKYDENDNEIDALDGEGFIASIYRHITQKSKWLSEGQSEAIEKVLTKIEAEKARVKAATYIGEVGQRLDLTLTLEKVVTWGEQWQGYTFLCIMKDENGSKVVYKGKSPHSLGLKSEYDPKDRCSYIKIGQTVQVKATIGEHKRSTYNGEPETYITRPKALEMAA
jgi:hypothetical protein